MYVTLVLMKSAKDVTKDIFDLSKGTHTLEEVLDKAYKGKKLCSKCKLRYHPEEYDICWDCFSKQPQRITEGYASQKDFEEANS